MIGIVILWLSLLLRKGLLIAPVAPGPDLKQAILLVFRDGERPLLILSSRRNEWAYQSAFDAAAEALQRGQHERTLKREYEEENAEDKRYPGNDSGRSFD